MPRCISFHCLPFSFLLNDDDCTSVARHEPVPRERLPALLVDIDTRDEKDFARLHKQAQKAQKRRRRVEAKREKQK